MAEPAPRVAILVSDETDLPGARELAAGLSALGVNCDLAVACALRTPHRVADLATNAEERGLRALVAAGRAAPLLAAMAAAHTPLPVLAVAAGDAGVPAWLGGAPVALVPHGSAAVELIAAIVALTDGDVRRRLADHRVQQAESVNEANRRLQEAQAEQRPGAGDPRRSPGGPAASEEAFVQ